MAPRIEQGIVAAVIAALAAACTSVGEKATATAGPAADEAAGGRTSCSGAAVDRQELVGKWSENASGPVMYTLDAVGSLKHTDSTGKDHIGRWQFVPWAVSPAARIGGQSVRWPCVLWIDLERERLSSPPLLLVPLAASDSRMDLMPVGGSDVVEWHRAVSR